MAVRRRAFSVQRIPQTVPKDVRRSINRDLWRSVRRSPAFWISTIIEALILGVIELPLLRWTSPGTLAHEIVPFLIVILSIPLISLNSNLLFEKERVSAWLSHGICPACGYNLTGNTSGVCPECGTKIENQRAEISN